MGGEVFDPPSEDEQRSSPDLFNQLHERPGGGGKINPAEGPSDKPSGGGKVSPSDGSDSTPGKVNPGGDAPGKINAGGRDTVLDQMNRVEMVNRTSEALRSGDFQAIQDSIRDAWERCGGDAGKFQRFGQALAEQMRREGITVKAGENNSISLHREGSPHGVEFKVDGQVDFRSGRMRGEVSAQTYDWVTKQDVNDQRPQDVMREMRNRPAAGNGAGNLRDAQELGAAFDQAHDSGNYNQLNADMARSFEHAYRQGGMQAVRRLEEQANRNAATPGGGPVVLEENGRLRILNAQSLSQDAAQLAAGMTAEQLAAQNIVRHPNFGYLRVVNNGPAPIDTRRIATR